MKTVYIVRHAKSSWDNIDVSDHDRVLMPVGIKKTKKIIKFLTDKNVLPDLILTSSAKRAMETAHLIADGIGYDNVNIIINNDLYHAFADEIYDVISTVSDSENSVMIVAHNPTLTDFVNDFINPRISNLPTTGVVSIEFETDSWEEISDVKFKVNFVVFPRMIE
ncbi:MAG: histidine phosphatase family protein [Bacteroidota bacterium]